MNKIEDDVLRLAGSLRSRLIDPVAGSLHGKREIVEVLAVGLVAGENVFLLGPPGTGKSALVHLFARLTGARSFDYLLTRFTEPSELFGPFDLRRLRDGELVTNTDSMLPEAEFVFLDELLNANSAILNSLLLALNERRFRRGNESFDLPMLMAVGASNRLPEEDALAALFDRFLLRVVCDNVADDHLTDVLRSGWIRERTTTASHVSSRDGSPGKRLDVSQLRRVQSAVAMVNINGVMPAYVDLIRSLRRAGMALSDRRAVRLQRVVAASALLAGRRRAAVSDLWVMRFIWDSPAQGELVRSRVEATMRQFGDAVSSPRSSGSTNERSVENTEPSPHPMSSPATDVDPETLRRAIDAVMLRDKSDQNFGGAAERLASLASRLAWVRDEVARADLSRRLDAAMKTVRSRAGGRSGVGRRADPPS